MRGLWDAGCCAASPQASVVGREAAGTSSAVPHSEQHAQDGRLTGLWYHKNVKAF